MSIFSGDDIARRMSRAMGCGPKLEMKRNHEVAIQRPSPPRARHSSTFAVARGFPRTLNYSLRCSFPNNTRYAGKATHTTPLISGRAGMTHCVLTAGSQSSGRQNFSTHPNIFLAAISRVPFCPSWRNALPPWAAPHTTRPNETCGARTRVAGATPRSGAYVPSLGRRAEEGLGPTPVPLGRAQLA